MNIHHLSEKFELNDLEKQIVGYISLHQDHLKSIGIRQMAKDNFTSTSSIYKLCNKFGFEGYSDMIYHLSSPSIPHTSFSTENIEQYSKEFNKLLQAYRNKRIVVFGLGFSSPIAEYIQQRLTLNGFYAMSVVHMEMFDKQHCGDTLFIVISNSGQTPRLMEIVETVNKQNVACLSFVANSNSKIVTNSTLSIVVGNYNSFEHEAAKPNTFFGEVIIAFESLLFSYLSSYQEL